MAQLSERMSVQIEHEKPCDLADVKKQLFQMISSGMQTTLT